MIKEALKRSKEIIKGKKLKAIGVYVLYMVLCMMFGGTTGAAFGIVLFLPFAAGLYLFFMNMVKGEEKLEDLIAFYIDIKRGLKLTLAMIWYILIIFVGLILFVIPGIVWAYRYVLSFFLLIDDENLSIEDAFKKSAKMMKGHKFKIFVTVFSIMWFPMVVYVAGTGMMSYAITDYAINTSVVDVVEEYEDNEDVVVEEVIEEIVEEYDESEELEEVPTIDEEVISQLPSTSAVLGAFLFFIGLILIIVVEPRAFIAEIVYYQNLLEKE